MLLRADYMHGKFQPGLSFSAVDRAETSARPHEQNLKRKRDYMAKFSARVEISVFQISRLALKIHKRMCRTPMYNNKYKNNNGSRSHIQFQPGLKFPM